MKTRKLLAGIMALALVCAVPVNLSPAVKDFSITVHAVDDGTKIVAGNLSCTVLSTDEDGTVNLQVNGFSDEVGDAETLEFPETVDGIPVRYVSIAGGAFEGSSLTEAILPDTIEEVNSPSAYRGVFEDCSSLKKVHLPEGGNFHCIANRIFFGCSSLEEINIPDSVNEIGENAFAETPLLTNQEEEPIKYIGNWAISCIEGIPLEFKEGTVGIANNFLANSTVGIESGTPTMIFPSSLRHIGSKAFYYVKDMNTVIIPNGIEFIHNNAFGNSDGLQEVIFSGTVGSIEENAFNGCENLTSVQFPETVGSVGDYAFKGCTNLTSVQFNGEISENFGEGVFSGCSSLPEIVLPEGITEISKKLFADCAKLANIDLPDSLTSIPDAESSFSGTALYADGLSDLRYADDWVIKVNSGFDGDNITIKDGAVGIAAEVFSKRKTLTSITFPDTLKYIEDNAFFECSVLTSATLPESVISIGDKAFCECRALTSVTFPESLVSIGDSAFFYCDSLTTVTIPESVTSIGEDAFEDCDALTSVELSESLISISRGTFAYCGSLTAITIPESVTSIGEDAFFSCSALTSITIENPDCEINGDQSTICNANFMDNHYNIVYSYPGIIYGHEGSTAQAYAEKYNRRFESLEGTTTKETTTTTEETTTKETTSNTEESTTAETTTSAEETATSSTVLETTTEEETSAIEETTTEEVTTSTAPETTETSSTVLETTTEETTTTKAPYASDKDFCDWAAKDYKQKTGTTPAVTSSITENGKTVITLLDENGEILDTYTIDPATGKGTTSNGAEVNLPQTGITSKATASTAVAAIAVTTAGIALMGIARKRDED